MKRRWRARTLTLILTLSLNLIGGGAGEGAVLRADEDFAAAGIPMIVMLNNHALLQADSEAAAS